MSNDEKMQEVVEVLHGINITDDAIELFVTSTRYIKKKISKLMSTLVSPASHQLR